MLKQQLHGAQILPRSHIYIYMSHCTDFWIACEDQSWYFPPSGVGGRAFSWPQTARCDMNIWLHSVPSFHLIIHVSLHGLLDCLRRPVVVLPHFSYHGWRSLSFSAGGTLPVVDDGCAWDKSFEDFRSWISLSKAIACSISFGMTLKGRLPKSTAIRFLSSKASNFSLERSSDSSFCSRGIQWSCSSDFRSDSCLDSSIKTRLTGNFTDRYLSIKWAFEELSVKPERTSRPCLLLQWDRGPKSITAKVTAKSSEAAMVRWGSPRTYSQGQFWRVISTENHRAFLGSVVWKVSQPPTRMPLSEAMASTLKTSPATPGGSARGFIGSRASHSAKNSNNRRMAIGSSVKVVFPNLEVKAYSGAKKGRAPFTAPAKKPILPTPGGAWSLAGCCHSLRPTPGREPSRLPTIRIAPASSPKRHRTPASPHAVLRHLFCSGQSCLLNLCLFSYPKMPGEYPWYHPSAMLPIVSKVWTKQRPWCTSSRPTSSPPPPTQELFSGGGSWHCFGSWFHPPMTDA